MSLEERQRKSLLQLHAHLEQILSGIKFNEEEAIGKARGYLAALSQTTDGYELISAIEVFNESVVAKLNEKDSTIDDNQIVLSMDDYNELVDDQNFLQCLQGAGVDNWDGYSYAQEMFDEMKKEDNKGKDDA